MLSGNSKAFSLLFQSISFVFSSFLGFPTSKAESLTSQGQTAGSRGDMPSSEILRPTLPTVPPPSGVSIRLFRFNRPPQENLLGAGCLS